MSTELVQSVGEVIEGLSSENSLEAVGKVLGNAGGFVVKEGGKLAAVGLIKRGWQRLCEEFKKRQQEGKIPEDFEQTDHGAKLLQEALNALSQGLDEDQAEAVRQVFLGLAQTPPRDAMERVQQLQILEVAVGLSPWELTALNLLERVSKRHFCVETSECYANMSDVNERGYYTQEIKKQSKPFSRDFAEFVAGQPDYKEALLQALESLAAKQIVDGVHSRHEISNAYTEKFVFQRRHWLSPFGWKIAVHLYSTEPEQK